MNFLLTITIVLSFLSLQNSFSFESSSMEFLSKDPNEEKDDLTKISNLQFRIAMKDHWACEKNCDNDDQKDSLKQACIQKCLISHELAAIKLFRLTPSELSKLIEEFKKSHMGENTDTKLHDLYKVKKN